MQSRMHLITLNASVPNKPFGIYLLVHSSNWFETLVIFDFGGTAVGGTWFRSGLTSQIGKNKGKSNAMACWNSSGSTQIGTATLEARTSKMDPPTLPAKAGSNTRSVAFRECWNIIELQLNEKYRNPSVRPMQIPTPDPAPVTLLQAYPPGSRCAQRRGMNAERKCQKWNTI